MRSLLVWIAVVALWATPLWAVGPEGRLDCDTLDNWLAIAVDVNGDVARLVYVTDIEAQKQTLARGMIAGAFHPITSSFNPCARQATFSLAARYQNPLTQSIQVSSTLGEDPNFKAVDDFLKSFGQLNDLLKSQGEAKEVSANSAPDRRPLELRSPLLSEWALWLLASGAACLEDEHSFLQELAEIDSKVYGPAASDGLRDIFGSMTRLDTLAALRSDAITSVSSSATRERMLLADAERGVDSIRAGVAKLNWKQSNAAPPKSDAGEGATAPTRKAEQGKAAKGKPQIDNQAGTLDPALQPAELCQPFQRYTEAKLGEFVAAAQAALGKRQQVLADLDELLSAFKRIRDSAINEELYRLDYLEIPRGKTRLVTVKVIPRKTVLVANELKTTEGATMTAEFEVRRRASVALEFGVAAAYTEIERPKYGTADQGGQAVVSDAGNDVEHAVAAATLNILFRSDWGPVNPMLQVGIGTGTERPSLLAGVGLRLSGASRMSVAVGAVFPWAKELRTLAVGSPISGTAELEKDLEIRLQDPELYIALQYNF